MESLKNYVPANTKKHKKPSKNKKNKKQTVVDNLSNNVKKKVSNKKPLDSSNDSTKNVSCNSSVQPVKDIYLKSLELIGIGNAEKENTNVCEQGYIEPFGIQIPTSSTIQSIANVPQNLTVLSEKDLYPQSVQTYAEDYNSATEMENVGINVEIEKKDNNPSTSSAFYSLPDFLANSNCLLPVQVLQKEDCEKVIDMRASNSGEKNIVESEMRNITGVVGKYDNNIRITPSVCSLSNLLRTTINLPAEDNCGHIQPFNEPVDNTQNGTEIDDQISCDENSSEHNNSSCSSSSDQEDIEADQQRSNFTEQLVSQQRLKSTNVSYEDSPIIFEIPKCEKISLNKSTYYSPNEESRRKLYELLASWKLEFMYDKFIGR